MHCGLILSSTSSEECTCLAKRAPHRGSWVICVDLRDLVKLVIAIAQDSSRHLVTR